MNRVAHNNQVPIEPAGLYNLRPEDLRRDPGALGTPMLRPYIAYERAGHHPTVPDNRADTAILPAVGGNEMPTREFRKVTKNGIPVPMPPRIDGPTGGTEITQLMPAQSSGREYPTEVLGRPTKYHARHAAGVVAKLLK